jgi:dCMP deaminase
MGKSWDQYFVNLAHSVARDNHSCLNRKVGAVFVRSDNSLIVAGYNGAPAGVISCGECGSCRRDKASRLAPDRYDHCIAVHAEQNCIAFAAKHGVALLNARAYVTHKPCIHCLRMMIQSGIAEIIYDEELAYYDNNETYAELENFHKIIMRKFLP